jgi:hypothetical protein
VKKPDPAARDTALLAETIRLALTSAKAGVTLAPE